jgi:H2-forming N5,N10-methylenetetrahydromethanopterin dehydrogenase-like enzyme
VRVLCISPLFPPLADAEAFCGGKMVYALIAAGHDVVVLCEPPSPTRLADTSSYWKQLESVVRYVDVPPAWKSSMAQTFSETRFGLSHQFLGGVA